jgi:hypothetical protein
MPHTQPGEQRCYKERYKLQWLTHNRANSAIIKNRYSPGCVWGIVFNSVLYNSTVRPVVCETLYFIVFFIIALFARLYVSHCILYRSL